MTTQPLTPNNPFFNNYTEVVEETILRYTKAGRWFELHKTSAMLAMFGYDRGLTFYDLPTSILKSIIHNFHESHGFDVTQEVEEEVQDGYTFHLVIA